jgi:hypothetical protein
MLRGATLLAAITLAAPASVQTFDDAVRANFGLGMQLCLSGGGDMAAWAGLFRTAGFAERVERSGTNSDTTHHFTAPADTVAVELYYGEQPEHCTVSTPHMGVTEASSVLDQIIPQRYPGYVGDVSQGAPDPNTGQPAICVSYEDPTNPIGHIVGVAPDSDSGGCVADGTSRFYSSYRV